MIRCTSPEHRKAYGWQRDGGHADYCVAEENTCVHLPDNLSYVDGAFMACGFGTAWECLTRMNVSGRDRLLVTGLGPVGLAAAQIAKSLGVTEIIGVDLAEGRLKLARELKYRNAEPLVDHVLSCDDAALDNIHMLTDSLGCEVSMDCSGAAPARLLALRGTRQWGRCGFVGEGGKVEFDVSPFLIHEQITLYGSWVTSRKHLADLANHLARLDVHPESTCGVKLPLAKAGEAYEFADKRQTGKVCIVFDD
jgi:threonine dehydrogenase-like Zn-dependent dehydrogenase